MTPRGAPGYGVKIGLNESKSLTALICGDARTEKTELENGLAEAAKAP